MKCRLVLGFVAAAMIAFPAITSSQVRVVRFPKLKIQDGFEDSGKTNLECDELSPL